MKHKLFALITIIAVLLMPTTATPISAGDAAYRIAAGCGGLLLASKSLACAVTSIYCGALATVLSATAVGTAEPAPLIVAIPLGAVSAISAGLSYGCGYLSYRCFAAAFAPEVIVMHHHYHTQVNEPIDENSIACAA